MANMPTITYKNRQLIAAVKPSLKLLVGKGGKTKDLDYVHESQLGTKILEHLCRCSLLGHVAVESDFEYIYKRLQFGTSKHPRWRSYIEDIRDALNKNPNTSLSVVGDHTTGWSIQ